MTFTFKHPKYYKELKKNLTKGNFSDKGEENNVAYYLNHNLMKVEANEFVSPDRYLITYEEVQVEL
jgi:uncharacterized protein YxeA